MSVATLINGDILTGLGDRPGASMTSRLLLALTALYVQRWTHTVEEQQQYVELALRLTDQVDAATRTAVAGILQRHPDAPAEVFRRIDDMQSSLDGNREGDGPAGGQLSTCDEDLSGEECRSMAAPSQAAPALAQLAPATSELGEAFFAASSAERRGLLSLIACSAAADVLAACEDGERTHAALDVAALHGRIGEFIREFGRVADIPKSLCERILNDPSGEPMVVAAKATGVPITILQRILLLVAPATGHSVQRVYDLTGLYHDLDRGAASTLLALWRAQAKSNDPARETEQAAGDRKPLSLRSTPVTNLRSRFGALTARLQSRAIIARPGPGSVARRGLRSR